MSHSSRIFLKQNIAWHWVTFSNFWGPAIFLEFWKYPEAWSSVIAPQVHWHPCNWRSSPIILGQAPMPPITPGNCFNLPHFPYLACQVLLFFLHFSFLLIALIHLLSKVLAIQHLLFPPLSFPLSLKPLANFRLCNSLSPWLLVVDFHRYL